MAKKDVDARAAEAAAAIEEEFGGEAAVAVEEPANESEGVADPSVTVNGLAGTMRLSLREVAGLSPAKGFRKTDTAEQSFLELVQSIKENGLICPVSVAGNKVIAGRRRLEAAKTAGLEFIPAVEVAADNDGQTLITFIDNVQRKNLNGIEEAKGMKSLLDKEIVKNRSELSRILGVTPGAITQKLSVLDLPPKLKKAITDDRISATAATQLKDTGTEIVDALLAAGEAETKRVTTKEAKEAATGRTSVTIPPVEGTPDDIKSIKLSADGATVSIFIAHPNKRWTGGELKKALTEISSELPDGIDGALTSARRELD